MRVSQKSFLKFGAVLILTAVILVYLFKDMSVEKFRETLNNFDYSWVLLSIGLSFIGYLLRAWRWTLLLNSSNYCVSLSNSYFAVMTGYLTNFIFPRLGEVTRCGVINKKHKVPLGFSIGTVVTERAIDLLVLLVLSVITFLLQFNLLSNYINSAESTVVSFLKSNRWLMIGLLVAIVGGSYLLFYTNAGKQIKFVVKVRLFVKQVIDGIVSIRKVKHQGSFWLCTLSIWVLYFFMLYVITFGSHTTAGLSVLAGMSILVMGSFGMAAPTPNGLATFHALVAGTLGLYGISEDEGLIFATIVHTSQLVTVLVFGLISLVLVNLS